MRRYFSRKFFIPAFALTGWTAMTVWTAASYAKVNYRNPLGENYYPSTFCVEHVSAPQTRDDRAQVLHYRSVTISLRKSLVAHPEFDMTSLYNYPQNGQCPDGQIRVYLEKDRVDLFQRLIGSEYVLHVESPGEKRQVSAEAKKRWNRIGRKMGELSKYLIGNGIDETFAQMQAQLEEELNSSETSKDFSGLDHETVVTLRREVDLYAKMIRLMALISPAGIESFRSDLEARGNLLAGITPDMIRQMRLPDTIKEEAYEFTDEARQKRGKKSALDEEIVNRIVWRIFGLFDEPLFHAHSADAVSSMAMFAFKELEDQFPLAMILDQVNRVLILRTLRGIAHFKPNEFGTPTKELLSYLIRFRPHLHPLISLTASAILKGAGNKGSRAPDQSDRAAYQALLEHVTLVPNRALEDVPTPHALYGSPGGRFGQMVTDVRVQLNRIDYWFSANGHHAKDWFAHKGPTVEIMGNRAEKRAQSPLNYKDCEGFLTQ